jgi:hypothetical protein
MEDDSGEASNNQRDEADDDSKQAGAGGFLRAGNSQRQQHDPEDGDGNFESAHCRAQCTLPKA